MTLEPLLSASPATRLHAFAAMAAFALGAVQLVRPKGDGSHRAIGWLWAAAMITVAASSFFIHEIDQWRGFSWIHLLSIQVLVTLPLAIHAARSGKIRRHRSTMVGMFIGALVVAGLLTLLPGRIMHAVLFGP
ncbi:MAG: DUF2306 domain-containing protein [Hyphomicrobiaceae bacterium]|nr:DUF2306 domain-containing protein [Hyphomicrobiaceae bacterium]